MKTTTRSDLPVATTLFAQASSVQLTGPPAAPPPSSTSSAVPEGGATDFRAYEGGEQRSGELLLIEAYSAIWLVAFVFILLSIRRQKRLEQRLDRLQEDLKRAAARIEQQEID